MEPLCTHYFPASSAPLSANHAGPASSCIADPARLPRSPALGGVTVAPNSILSLFVWSSRFDRLSPVFNDLFRGLEPLNLYHNSEALS
eukprot:1225671-Rhodomonas_salina.1